MRLRLILSTAIILLFITYGHASDTTYGNVRILQINSVYDGDTFRCDIAGFPPIIGDNIGIRINGIDTPEMRDKRPQVKALAIKARDYVRSRLRQAQTIELRNIQRGKYFRIVADVFVDGVSIGQELIDAGMAYEYHGGKKQNWAETIAR